MSKKIRKILRGVIDVRCTMYDVRCRAEKQKRLGNFESFLNVRHFSKLSLFVLALFFQNCEETNEVCQDIRATNYDAAGRKACKNCCTFPQLVIETVPFVGDSFFVPNKTFYTTNRDSFRIDSTFVYLSDFQLFTSDGKRYTTSDTINLFRANDTLRILNSFADVIYGRFQNAIGTFADVGKTYTKIRFKIGLNDTARLADPTKMSPPHPLSRRADSLNLTTQKAFIFNRLKIRKGAGFRDSVEIRVLSPAKTLELTMNVKTTEGVNAVIPLRINYLRLFEGVNFSDPANLFQQKVVNNLEKVFYVR
jgi:hypothetical protein